MKSVVAYIRMSSAQQDLSPEQQAKAIRELAEKRKVKIIRTYQDSAISGTESKKRLDLMRLLRDVSKGDFVEILCYDQDRFSRADSLEVGEIIAPLRRAGIKLVTCAQGEIDWDSFAGRIVYTVQQEGKNSYVRDLSRVCTRGRIEAAKRGRSQGSIAYGYEREYRDKSGAVVHLARRGERFACPRGWEGKNVPSENQREVEAVRFAFERFASTETSIEGIAVEMNERGYPAPCGGRWNVSTLRLLLKRPTYVGTLEYGASSLGKFHTVTESGPVPSNGKPMAVRPAVIVVENSHRPLVSRDVFDRVQQKLAKRQFKKRHPNRKDYILTGLLSCQHCGAPMIGCAIRKSGAEHRYYVCNQQNRRKCKRWRVRKDEIESYVLNAVQEYVLAPERMDALRKSLLKQAKLRTSGARATSSLTSRLADLDRKIDRAESNILMADDPDLVAGLIAKLRGMKDERASVAREVQAAKREKTTPEKMVEAALDRVYDLSNALKSGDPLEVKHGLSLLIEGVMLNYTREHGERNYTLAGGRIEFASVGFSDSNTCNAGDKTYREFTGNDVRESRPETGSDRAAVALAGLCNGSNRWIRTGQVADKLGIGRPAATEALQRAQARGLVERNAFKGGKQAGWRVAQ